MSINLQDLHRRNQAPKESQRVVIQSAVDKNSKESNKPMLEVRFRMENGESVYDRFVYGLRSHDMRMEALFCAAGFDPNDGREIDPKELEGREMFVDLKSDDLPYAQGWRIVRYTPVSDGNRGQGNEVRAEHRVRTVRKEGSRDGTA
ncbi:MAG: hypothetical protein V1809_08920 [Planctomycetota bacterium]